MSANVSDFAFLKGVKVVDFTQFEAGPSCTEALGWLGADVVKIENPKMGDPGRRLRPGQPDNDPYYFHAFNANKKSITVNLKSPKGLALVKDMLARADVMIENFAPGAIERLGLSYDVVKAIRSEEHTPELQSHSFISYAVFCLKKKNSRTHRQTHRVQLRPLPRCTLPHTL